MCVVVHTKTGYEKTYEFKFEKYILYILLMLLGLYYILKCSKEY